MIQPLELPFPPWGTSAQDEERAEALAAIEERLCADTERDWQTLTELQDVVGVWKRFTTDAESTLIQ